jgi:hypothetical protein
MDAPDDVIDFDAFTLSIRDFRLLSTSFPRLCRSLLLLSSHSPSSASSCGTP